MIRVVLKKGNVKMFPTVFTADGEIFITDKTRSASVTNTAPTGGADVILFPDSQNQVVLSPKMSTLLGGYDDAYRTDNIEFVFSGVGARSLTLFEDKEVSPSEYIIYGLGE